MANSFAALQAIAREFLRLDAQLRRVQVRAMLRRAFRSKGIANAQVPSSYRRRPAPRARRGPVPWQGGTDGPTAGLPRRLSALLDSVQASAVNLRRTVREDHTYLPIT